MTYAQSSDARQRRKMALALLATTAVAVLIGGCTPTRLPFSGAEEKLSAPDAIGAIAQWSAAYSKNPQDPKVTLGYARSLKAIGSRDKALEILIAGYRANQNDGPIAAELGRFALDMGRLDIAQQTLKVAETQGVKDWKTLSAQGTLRAKQGRHAEAQQYFLAALQEQPDAVSVINNLALSYALDGKAQKSEELLRKAVDNGHGDKRVRQNLALVLGLQGKFEEARQVASLDMSDQDAKANMAYLRNMLSKPTQFAAAAPDGTGDSSADDWQPFDTAASTKAAAPSKSAATTPAAAPKVQVVKASEEIKAPSAATPAKAAQAPAPAKPSKVAPTLITPAKVTPAPGGTASLLRTDTD